MFGTLRKTHLLAVSAFLLAAALVGCAGGGNGSSSAPSVLGVSTLQTSTSAPDVVFRMAVGGEIKFSHKDHIEKYNQKCDACHTNDNPFPKQIKAQGKTMAQLAAGESCGVCHKAGGSAFDAQDKTRCKACHQNAHDNVNPNVVGEDVCGTCHALHVTDMRVKKATGTPLVHVGVGQASARTGSCGECHNHDSVFGKTVGLATTGTPPSCQTCHFAEKDAAAANAAALTTGKNMDENRLRNTTHLLCGTCHHMRYTYGDPANNAVGFPTLLPATVDAGGRTDSAKSSWPVEWKAAFRGGNVQNIFSTSGDNQDDMTANLATFVSRYLNAGPPIRGNNYPHDSPQYDVHMGAGARTFCLFTNRANGAALTYNDTIMHRASATSCADCHFHKTADTLSYSGHRLSDGVPVAACQKCHQTAGATFKTDAMHAIETKLHDLGTLLDANKNGTVEYTRGSGTLDADLQIVMNSNTLSVGQKIVLLGAAWNYNAIHGDFSEGVHNPQFVRSLIDNTILVVQDLNITW